MSSPQSPGHTSTTNTSTAAAPQTNNSINNLANGQLLNELSQNLGVSCEEFMCDTFDYKKYTNAIMKTKILGEHLTKLSQCTHLLDKEIREQISLHHEDLLNQAINIETLEEMLDMVQARILALKSTSERLRVKISTPFNELKLRIVQLTRLQSACDMLRRIKGIIHHTAKLRVHMQSGLKDIVKSAQALNELEFLLKDFDCVGIEIIENDIHFIHKAKREVEEQANSLLETGLMHQNQSQISTALQVFYNLGCLVNKIIDTLKNYEKTFQKVSNDLLNPVNVSIQSTSSSANLLQTSQSSSNLVATGANASSSGPGRSTMPGIGSMGQFRATLWSNVEKLMDTLFDMCSQIAQLQKILLKKKDLLTNVYYADEIDLTKISKTKVMLKTNDDNNYIEYEQGKENADSSPSTDSSRSSVEFLYEYWRILIGIVNTNLYQSCLQSNYVKQTLQNEYPKLLKLQNDLWMRIVQLSPLIERYLYFYDNKADPQQQQITQEQQAKTLISSYDLLRKCFFDLENSYLTRSLSNIFDSINFIFCQTTSSSSSSSNTSGIPTSIVISQPSTDNKRLNRNDLEQYVKSVQTQLQTIQYDLISAKYQQQQPSATYSHKIIKNLCKSIQMFANKCEQYINYTNSDGTSATKFTFNAQPSQEQASNLDCINYTYELYELLNKLFTDTKQQFSFELNEQLKQMLNDALNNYLLQVIKNSMKPVIQSASDCIEAIILSLHNEDFNSTQSHSLYIKELQQVLNRICKDYLYLYKCKPILNDYLKQLASRCLDLFIRHSTIYRPVTDNVRKRLLNDSIQIESTIGVLSTKLNDLGNVYRQLKAFRNLLQISNDNEITQQLNDSIIQISESLPFSLILHYLFARYAPNELKSPHQSLNLTPVVYSQWLDKHVSERERLLMIKDCLEAYVLLIKQKNEKQFASVYPVMVQLLEKGLQSS